jgi:hypothetical protein
MQFPAQKDSASSTQERVEPAAYEPRIALPLAVSLIFGDSGFIGVKYK